MVNGLMPGQYLIRVPPPSPHLAKQFPEEDTRKVDQDYQESFWPGGGDLDSATPIALSSGASVSAGTVKARKGLYSLSVNQPGERLGSVDKGSVAFEIRGSNATVPIALGQGVEVEGRVTASDSYAKPPFDRLKIAVKPVTSLVFVDEGLPVSPDADGKFHIAGVRAGAVEISVSGIRAPFYLRELRYNGVALKGNRANNLSSAGTIEIVIDDQPGSVSGAVADNDRPAGKPYLALVKWPASGEDVFLSLKTATGDADGKFEFTGLAPGDYRVVAVAQQKKDKLEEPHVLERLLGTAERITIDRGGAQNVALKLTDPAR
jgi:hypothetical protein